jgi:hypothetical protein
VIFKMKLANVPNTMYSQEKVPAMSASRPVQALGDLQEYFATDTYTPNERRRFGRKWCSVPDEAQLRIPKLLFGEMIQMLRMDGVHSVQNGVRIPRKPS